jgi:hypothetical protein
VCRLLLNGRRNVVDDNLATERFENYADRDWPWANRPLPESLASLERGPGSASPGSIEEAVGALAKLKEKGKIRHIGVSNFDEQRAIWQMVWLPFVGSYRTFLVAPGIGATGMLDQVYGFDRALGLTTTSNVIESACI